MNLLLRVSFTATVKTFRQVVRNRVSPPWNVNTYNTLMIRRFAAAGNLQSESKKARDVLFGLLKAATTDKDVEPNSVSFNAAIQRLCAGYSWIEAEAVFEEMKRKGLAPDERTYTSLIRVFSSMCTIDKAYKVLSEMIDTGFSPSVATYNILVRACCCNKRVEEAVGILRVMAERGLSPDTVSYNHVIERFCELEELEKAFEMKAEMLEKGILPDAETYSSLIKALCPLRRLSEAYDLFREMLRRGVSPDKHTYTSLTNAYCLEGKISKAFHLHDEMIHKGFLPHFVSEFSPSLVTYNALIHGLSFLGRVEEAREILQGTAERGVSANFVGNTSVISGFCKLGELRKAFDTKFEMDIWWMDQGVYSSLVKGLSDEATYTSLMNAYCAEGEVDKALRLDYVMEHDGSLPDSVTFSVLINGLDKKARTREAKQTLLSLFYCSGWTQPSFTYDTLIENCSDNNEFKSVVELVKGFWMRGLENEAVSVFNTVLQWNYKPDGAVYNLLIVEHCRCRNVDKAYNMYMEMVHYGFASHIFSVLALVHGLFNVGRCNEIRRVIQNVLRSCNLNDSELHKALDEIDCGWKGKFKIENALENVLAEIAMDGNGMLLNGGNCSYAPASA